MTIAEMMDATWNQYETERKSGNKELADKIGDVYTILDIIEMNGGIEENRDFAERTYYSINKAITKELIHGEETPAVKVYRMLEEALVNAGILEDEEPEDYTNDAQHFDEWVADQRHEAYMDDAMCYER